MLVPTPCRRNSPLRHAEIMRSLLESGRPHDVSDAREVEQKKNIQRQPRRRKQHLPEEELEGAPEQICYEFFFFSSNQNFLIPQTNIIL